MGALQRLWVQDPDVSVFLRYMSKTEAIPRCAALTDSLATAFVETLRRESIAPPDRDVTPDLFFLISQNPSALNGERVGVTSLKSGTRLPACCHLLEFFPSVELQRRYVGEML